MGGKQTDRPLKKNGLCTDRLKDRDMGAEERGGVGVGLGRSLGKGVYLGTVLGGYQGGVFQKGP